MKNIFIFPTNGESKLVQIKDNFFITSTKDIPSGKYFHIYITNDEDIKVDNWYIEHTQIKPNRFEVFKAEIDDSIENSKKIILATDPKLIADGVQIIDDEFLEWFVNNPSCEFVEVINDTYTVGEMSKLPLGTRNHEYKLIIPQEEPTQETLEEGANWMSKTMYSEFEVLQLLLRLKQTKSYDNLYDWFDQHKKK
jgi:hypothetical protein